MSKEQSTKWQNCSPENILLNLLENCRPNAVCGRTKMDVWTCLMLWDWRRCFGSRRQSEQTNFENFSLWMVAMPVIIAPSHYGWWLKDDDPRSESHKMALESQPDVVVIKLGTNDTKPQNWKFKEEFLADCKDLIEQFARLPSKPRIFICHPAFVPGNGNYGINEAGVLEELPLLDQIAADESADVIDIHGALKDHPELLPDRILPNDRGATVLAKTIFQALTGKEFTEAAPVVTADTGGK